MIPSPQAAIANYRTLLDTATTEALGHCVGTLDLGERLLHALLGE